MLRIIMLLSLVAIFCALRELKPRVNKHQEMPRKCPRMRVRIGDRENHVRAVLQNGVNLHCKCMVVECLQ